MLTSLATYVGVRIIFYPKVYVLEAYDFSTGRWLLKKGNYMDSVQFVITDPNILNELKSQWVLSKDRFRELDGATTGGYIVELHNDGKRVFSMDICYREGPGELYCGEKGGYLNYDDLHWLEIGHWTPARDIYRDFESKQQCDRFLDSLNQHATYFLLWRTDTRVAVTLIP